MGNCGWKLTIKKVHEGTIINNPINSDNCIICFEEITQSDRMDNVITRTKCCNKRIHKKCFPQWDRDNYKCPHCRMSSLTPMKQKTINDIYQMIEKKLPKDKSKILGI